MTSITAVVPNPGIPAPGPLFLTDIEWPGLLSTQPVGFVGYTLVRPTWRCSLASLDPSRPDDLNALVSELRRLLDGMRHGSVTVIVQDGRVVQLDATHKVRLVGAAAERQDRRA